MKFFSGCFKKLPAMRPDSTGHYHKRLLSNPASWSAADLALLIRQERYYREEGVELPVVALRKLLKNGKSRIS